MTVTLKNLEKGRRIHKSSIRRDFCTVSTAAEKREKRRIENEEKVQKALGTLQQVVESNITPRNIRKIVKDAINMLNDTKISIGVRAANSISILEEVSQDPNMPSFSRVTIWSAVSTLESVRES